MSLDSASEGNQRPTSSTLNTAKGLQLPKLSPGQKHKEQLELLLHSVALHRAERSKDQRVPDALVLNSSETEAVSARSFTASHFSEACAFSAESGRPILLVSGNTNTREFNEYQQTVLPKLKERFQHKVTIVVADTGTQEGWGLAAKNWVRGEVPNTMLLTVRHSGDGFETEHVSGSWFVGTSKQFIPDHIARHLKNAYSRMEQNGFPLRADAATTSSRSGVRKNTGEQKVREGTDKKKADHRAKPAKQDVELQPGVEKDVLQRPTKFVSRDGTVVEYRYRSEQSKEPDTIVIDGVSAWVPNQQRNRWHRYSGGDGHWAYSGYWDGAMGPSASGSGEFEFTPPGKDSTRWTIRGGTETIREDGSSLEMKGRHVLKATASDGSTLEPMYECNEIAKFKETSFGPGRTKEEIIWKRKGTGPNGKDVAWVSEQQPGETRLNLRLTDQAELKYSREGKEYISRRDGTQLMHEPATRSTIKTNKAGDILGIEFGDGTIRKYAWKHTNYKGVDQKELTGVTVMTPDKFVYNWFPVGRASWSCNGKEPIRMRFDVSADRYSYTDLEKGIGVDRDLTGAVVRLGTTSGAEAVFIHGTDRQVTRIEDKGRNGVTKVWTRRNGNFVSGREVRCGKLVINAEEGRYEFVQSDGIRYLHTPGQREETRGTAAGLMALIAKKGLGSEVVDELKGRIHRFEADVQAEGMPNSKVIDIYNHLSDKLDAASDRRALAQAVVEMREELTHYKSVSAWPENLTPSDSLPKEDKGLNPPPSTLNCT